MLRDIYFLNAMKLIDELRSGEFSEIQALKHFIVISIFGGISIQIPVTVDFVSEQVSWNPMFLKIFAMVIFALINYYGIWLAYQTNKKGDGKDFFFRFLALMLPIGCRLAIYFAVISIVVTFLIYLSIDFFGTYGTVVFTFSYVCVYLAFYLSFYLSLKNHFEKVAGCESV